MNKPIPRTGAAQIVKTLRRQGYEVKLNRHALMIDIWQAGTLHRLSYVEARALSKQKSPVDLAQHRRQVGDSLPFYLFS